MYVSRSDLFLEEERERISFSQVVSIWTASFVDAPLYPRNMGRISIYRSGAGTAAEIVEALRVALEEQGIELRESA